MALRKPLVLNGGQIEELLSSDNLDATVAEVDVLTRVAAATLIAGQPVYESSATDVDKAAANADATSKCIGLAKAAIAAAASGTIQTSGVITLTAGEWDAVCGITGGLAVGTQYFLSATAGLLTSTAPSTSGNYVLPVIVGLSSTEAIIVVDWTQRIKKA